MCLCERRVCCDSVDRAPQAWMWRPRAIHAADTLNLARKTKQSTVRSAHPNRGCCCCCWWWWWWWCCWCRCCWWCGAALRLDSTRASRASDAAGGVAGGSDRGSTVEVEAGGCGGPLSLFNGRVRGLGVQPGGRGFNQATEDRGPSRGRARRRRAR